MEEEYLSGITGGASKGAGIGSMFAPGIGTGVGALAGGLLGAFQTYQAMKGLKGLQNQPKPNYTISPELQSSYDRAQRMSNRGFTGAEKASFDQNLAMENAAQTRALQQQAGGGLAGSIFAGIQGRNIGALNKFAAQDAALQRQNIQYADNLGQQIQNQRNLGTGVDVQRRLMQEQALGAGMNKGLENIVNSIGSAGALFARLKGGYGGGGMNAGNGVMEQDFRPGSNFEESVDVTTSPVTGESYSTTTEQNIANDEMAQAQMLGRGKYEGEDGKMYNVDQKYIQNAYNRYTTPEAQAYLKKFYPSYLQ